MNVFRFAHPEYLILLVALFLAPVARRRFWSDRKPAIHFTLLGAMSGIGRSWRVRFQPLLTVIRYLALALIVVALARPQAGWAERRIHTYGVDIMLALDVSESMALQDFRPNRLEAAKSVIEEFLEKRQFDRIGVVIFGDSAFTLVPLTLDYGAIKSFIDRLTFQRLGGQRTALGLGLATAVDRLRESDAKSHVVVLLTDGVDTVGGLDPLDAATVAESLGVRAYTIGVGGNAGGFGMFGGGQGFDEATLREIANRTGGKYYHATSEKELREIYDEIDRLEKSPSEYTDYTFHEERMAWLLAPGLLLLALEALLRNTLFLKLP